MSAYKDLKSKISELLLDSNASTYKIDHLLSELGRLVIDTPSNYPDYHAFSLIIPKKHTPDVLNPYDLDYLMESVAKWLAEEKKNVFSVINIKDYPLPKDANIKKRTPDNDSFMNIHKQFVGVDELRQNVMGTNFDAKGACSTDAMQLFFTIKDGNDVKAGLYFNSKKKTYPAKKVLDEKFPRYMDVIPSHTKSHVLNVEAMYNWLQNCIKSRMLNNNTMLVAIHTPDGQDIGLNATYLINGLEAMAKLGHNEIEISWSAPNRGVAIFPKGKIKDVVKAKTDFVLLMPVMLNNGWKDEEFNFPFTGFVYDIANNEVFDEEGNTYSFGHATPANQSLSDHIQTKEAIELLKELVEGQKGKHKQETLEAIELLEELL
jgi:hypothetical protein